MNEQATAIVRMRVEPGLKAGWVRKAQGMRKTLSAWITERLEDDGAAWIGVKDRLPSAGIQVEICNVNNRKKGRAMLYWPPTKGFAATDQPDFEATHWRPIAVDNRPAKK